MNEKTWTGSRIERRARATIGTHAEQKAAAEAEARGMTIIGRNVRIGYLELDLLALDGDTLVVIEVRCRGQGAWQGPLASIGKTKIKRLRRAGQIVWSRYNKRLNVSRVRFDVIGIDARTRPSTLRYIRAAFV